MKNHNLKILIILLVLVFLILNFQKIQAQSPSEIILTWRAFSYAPPEYSGKHLPTRRSLVTAAVAVIDNQGRLQDLSQKEIRWYLDNNLIRSGRGIVNFSFETGNLNQGLILRVTAGEVDKFAAIPLTQPQLILVRDGEKLTAQPYFFNIEKPTDLRWRWEIDGEEFINEAAEPYVIVLPGPTKTLNVSAQNPENELEFASNSLINL